MTAEHAKRLEELIEEIKVCSDRLSKLNIGGKDKMLMACDEVMKAGNKLLKIHNRGETAGVTIRGKMKELKEENRDLKEINEELISLLKQANAANEFLTKVAKGYLQEDLKALASERTGYK